jgi:hypothetical protein
MFDALPVPYLYYPNEGLLIRHTNKLINKQHVKIRLDNSSRYSYALTEKVGATNIMNNGVYYRSAPH